MIIKDVINHVRNHSYMDDIQRDKNRVLQSQEVFTPTDKVIELLQEYSEDLKDPAKKFLDPSCGDGQFLGEVLISKIKNGINFETALRNIYGVDIMQDNIKLCRERLLCGREDLRHIVEKNIVCTDALDYHYRFDGTLPSQPDLLLVEE